MMVGITPPEHSTGWFFSRGFPLSIAVSIVAIIVTSEVQRNLLVIRGTAADVVLIAYCVLLLVLSFTHVHSVKLHQLGAIMAAGTWGGRGGGFIELSLDRGSWALVGAVAERFLLATALVLWHSVMAYRIGRQENADAVRN